MIIIFSFRKLCQRQQATALISIFFLMILSDGSVVAQDWQDTILDHTANNTNSCFAKRKMLPKGAYLLPYRHNTTQVMANGPKGFGWHSKEYAWDWPMKVGTPIYAARSGIVVAIKKDSDRGGATQNYANDANYIIIKHKDGSLANYLHFQHGGVLVKKGQRICVGDKIGKSGNTGWSTQPHLHFHVASSSLKTQPLLFLVGHKKSGSLVPNTRYKSYHPWKGK